MVVADVTPVLVVTVPEVFAVVVVVATVVVPPDAVCPVYPRITAPPPPPVTGGAGGVMTGAITVTGIENVETLPKASVIVTVTA